MTLETLTEKDAARFQTLTQVVLDNKESFLTACMALAQIHRDRLYRQDFLSFEAYCRDRLGFTRQHGYRLIDFANQVEATPMGDTPPANERQARKRKAKEKPAAVGAVAGAPLDRPHINTDADDIAASLGCKNAEEALKRFESKQSPLPKMLFEALDLAKEEIAVIIDPDFDITDCEQLHASAKQIRKAANELDRYVKTVCVEKEAH